VGDSSGAAGRVDGGGAAAGVASDVPQLLQKRAAGAVSCPHCGHVGHSTAWHSWQNLPPGGFSDPQMVQRIKPSSSEGPTSKYYAPPCAEIQVGEWHGPASASGVRRRERVTPPALPTAHPRNPH